MVGRALHGGQRATDDDAMPSPSANIEHRLTTQYDEATPPAPPRLSLSNWSIRFRCCWRRISPVPSTTLDVLYPPRSTHLSSLEGIRWSTRVLPLRSRRRPAQPNVFRVSFPDT